MKRDADRQAIADATGTWAEAQAEQHEARRTKGARVVVVADDWRGRREYPATVAIPLGEARIARYRGKIGVKYDTGGFAWVHEYEVWSHD